MIVIPKSIDSPTTARPVGVIGYMSPNPTVVSVVSPKYNAAKKSENAGFTFFSASYLFFVQKYNVLRSVERKGTFEERLASRFISQSVSQSVTNISPDATKTSVMIEDRILATSSCHFFTEPAPAHIGPKVRSNEAPCSVRHIKRLAL